MLFTCAYSAFAVDVAADETLADDAAYNYRPGDVNNDGYVGADDARSILRYAVYLYDWNDIARLCYNAGNYDYRLAADVVYDGRITSEDARMALRISVGLESVSYDTIAFTTKQQIIDFYDRAVDAVKDYGYAGFTRTSYQYVKEEECNIMDLCNGQLIKHINNNLTEESEATAEVYALNSWDARCEFPDFTLNEYSYVKSATCTVNAAGNYVLKLVMVDADTTSVRNCSFLYGVTDQQVTWDDIEPVLDSSTQIKNWKGESVITKNFTITAEVTPYGQFVSMKHEGEVVISVDELTTLELLILPVTHNDKTATIHTTTVYSAFDYSHRFYGISCNPPAAYGTIDQICDFLKICLNDVAYYGSAGYTFAKKQKVDSDNTKLGCITNTQVSKYLNNTTMTTEKGTDAAWVNFPAFNLNRYDWIESAECSVNDVGNYVFKVEFLDADTSDADQCNILQAVTNDLIYFDDDVAPALRDMTLVNSFEAGSVTYQNFTITAEVTPNGDFVSMNQTAKVIITSPSIKTLLINYKDQQLALDIENSYTNFTY